MRAEGTHGKSRNMRIITLKNLFIDNASRSVRIRSQPTVDGNRVGCSPFRARREPEDARRIRPLRVALQNRRDDLLAFAGVLDGKLASIVKAHEIHQSVVREACVLQRLPSTSSAYWQGWTGFERRRAANSTLSSTP
jgi:hypothetical protein